MNLLADSGELPVDVNLLGDSGELLADVNVLADSGGLLAGLNILPWGLDSELGVLGYGTCAAMQAPLVLIILDALSSGANL